VAESRPVAGSHKGFRYGMTSTMPDGAQAPPGMASFPASRRFKDGRGRDLSEIDSGASCFRMRRGNQCGFGRAALAKEDGEDHDRSHGEELALPILEWLVPELRCGRILKNRNRFTAMLKLLCT